MLDVHYDILKKWPHQRGIDVRYFTSETEAAAKSQRDAWIARFREERPDWTEEFLMDQAYRHFHGGRILHIQFFDGIPLTADELHAIILDRMPHDDLRVQHEEIVNPTQDWSVVDQLQQRPQDQRKGVPQHVLERQVVQESDPVNRIFPTSKA